MVGKIFGHYEIVDELGRGGMGVVYRAHDQQLKRQVALKLVSEDINIQDSARARLLREAQLASALNNPYICTIYEVGMQDEQPYIAMEFVSGNTLASLAREHKLPVQTAVRYALQIADALEHAHAQGIIHRDLKSSNILITHQGRAKILDFGLAKREITASADEATRSELSLTRPGAMVGTLQYLPPEVLRGGAADARSDIWAFGVVFYEMLTGRLPFREKGSYELVTAILRDPLPQLPPQVPAPLRRIVERCLVKEPAQRYGSAGEVRAALETVTTSARALEAPSFPHLRRRVWQATGALLLSVLLAVSAYLVRQNLHLGRPSIHSVAVLPFAISNSDPESDYVSDGITEKLINDLSRLPQMKVISRVSVFHYKGKEVDPISVGRELGVDAILMGTFSQRKGQLSVTAELINTTDRSRIWGDQYSENLIDLANLNRKIASDLTGQLRTQLTQQQKQQVTGQQATNSEAYQDYLKGMYHQDKATPEELEKSRVYMEQAIAKDPTYAPAYGGLARSYGLKADYGLAPPAELWPKARAAADKALQIDPNESAALDVDASVKLIYDRNWAAAEQSFKNNIQHNGGALEGYREYALYLRTMGRADEAIAAMRKAQELDPLSVAVSGTLGWTYFYLHRYDDAVRQFQTTIGMDNSYLEAHFGLANAYFRNGEEAQAVAEFQNYLTISGDPEDAQSLQRLHRQSGTRAALEWLWQRQLDSAELQAKEGYVSPMIIASLHSLLGQKEETLQWLEKAFAERSPKLIDLKIDPDFEWLHSDPRFQDLLRRIGLP